MLDEKVSLSSHLLNLMWHCQLGVGAPLPCLIPRCGRVNVFNLSCTHTQAPNGDRGQQQLLRNVGNGEVGQGSWHQGLGEWSTRICLRKPLMSRGSKPQVHAPLSHCTPLTKHKYKDKLAKNFKTVITEHYPQAQGLSEPEYLYGCSSS